MGVSFRCGHPSLEVCVILAQSHSLLAPHAIIPMSALSVNLHLFSNLHLTFEIGKVEDMSESRTVKP